MKFPEYLLEAIELMYKENKTTREHMLSDPFYIAKKSFT
jgi:hypothetical protein